MTPDVFNRPRTSEVALWVRDASLSEHAPDERPSLTINDFVFHPMQLAHDLIQDFLRDNTALLVQSSAHGGEKFHNAVVLTMQTDLFHPVELCVGFTRATNGSHPARGTDQFADTSEDW